MKEFFSADGPLFRAMTDITNLLLINVYTLICSLPIVTAGAALASCDYMIMKMRDGEDGHVTKDFFTQFKHNLKTVTPVWLLFLGIAVILYVDYYFLILQNESSAFLIPFYVLLVLFFAVIVWAFPLMAKFENTFFATLKNMCLYAVGYFPRTLMMVFIYMGVLFLFTQVASLLPLFFVCGLSLPAYLSSFFFYPVIKDAVDKILGVNEEDENEEGETEPVDKTEEE